MPHRILVSLLLSWFATLAMAAPAPPRVAANAPVLVLGDSLSAAYRIAPDTGWVHLLESRAAPRAVVNASISGETSAGGLSRLPALLAEHKPAVVVVELGANDGLRGLPIAEIRANVSRIIAMSRDAGAKVLLLGIELPVNYGPQYRDQLRGMYRDLAGEFNVPLVPFLLEGVALDPTLMQEDGLHPTSAGEPRVLENVWPQLGPLLKAAR